MFKKATLEQLRVKSQQLTAYLELLIDALLENLYVDLVASTFNGNQVRYLKIAVVNICLVYN